MEWLVTLIFCFVPRWDEGVCFTVSRPLPHCGYAQGSGNRRGNLTVSGVSYWPAMKVSSLPCTVPVSQRRPKDRQRDVALGGNEEWGKNLRVAAFIARNIEVWGKSKRPRNAGTSDDGSLQLSVSL